MSAIPLRVLIVEDSPDDVTLLVRILRKGGFEPSFERVQTEDAMRSALLEKPWDLILSDYRMPNFDGLRAIAVLKESGLDIPLIIVSGTIGEEIAVAAMKAGASDYVMKGNLPRLIPAIERELKEAVSREEKKKGEQNLRESEERYRLLFENMIEGYAYCKMFFEDGKPLDFVYLAVNDAFERLTGLKNVVDKKVSEVIPDVRGSNPELFEIYGRVASTGNSERAEIYLDSLGIWFSLSVYSSEREYFVAVFDNITERKQAEDALRESEERYRAVFENAAVGIDTLDRDGRIVQVNPALCNMLGYDEDELKELTFEEITYPDDRQISKQNLESLTIGEKDLYRLEKRYLRKDGEIVWAELSTSAIKDTNGNHAGMVAVIADITGRKRAEEALRLSEAQKTAILNGITTNIALVNDKLEIQWVNKTGAESVGRSPEEMIGTTCHSLWADPERPCENCPTLKAFQTKKSEETIMTTPDGRVWNERGEPVLDDRGNLIGVVELAQDITEYKRLTEQEKRLVTAIEQAAEGVVITDATGIIQYVNPAEEKISGYSSGKLIGQGADIFKSDKHSEDFYTNMWATIKAGKVWTGRFIKKRKDGTEYHEDATISPVYDKFGNLTNFVAVKHDVTKQIQLQEQIFQAQKMEAIGTLAGGFAHDLNNKLQVISGYVELILFNKELPETVKSELGVIKKTVDSSTELIKGMMVFSRKTPTELQPIDLNRLATQTRAMLTQSIPKMIEIDLLLADDLWAIKASPNQVDQILMNLAINARDAMPDSGKITIKTQNITIDEEYCRLNPLAKPGKYVLITVSDTGVGMNKETASHIFEPFFTTKEAGKGTGLGLAVVYGIVERHGGRIICNSEPSVGTTFTIYFPAIEEVPEEQYSEKKEPPKGKGETILLVDDEPNFLEIASRQLTGANYKVITASNGKEALDFYEKHREQVNLIILDLIMPKMSGGECLQALLRMDPMVRVLVVSGAQMMGMDENMKASGAKGLVKKPFDMSHLLEKIRKIIDED
jgi:PAS domain S-box-containing protein